MSEYGINPCGLNYCPYAFLISINDEEAPKSCDECEEKENRESGGINDID